MTTVTRRFTFKLYPNVSQDAAMHEQRRMCGVLWNAALQQREYTYARSDMPPAFWYSGDCRGKRRSLTAFDQSREIKFLRRECPEFKAISASTAARVFARLDEAFKAFYRRLKELKADPALVQLLQERAFQRKGRRPSIVELAGYPRYARTAEYPSVPQRDGGWRMRRTGGDNWKVGGMFGIPGEIRARGCFPAEVESFRSAELLWRDGHWWLSAVVKLPARMRAGSGAATVRFDLIEEFASIIPDDGANGGCATAPKGGIVSPFKGLQENPCGHPENGGQAQASRQTSRWGSSCGHPENGGQAQEEVRAGQAEAACGHPENEVDALKARRDANCQRGSCRWRKLSARIARIQARAARQRKEALHRWTTEIVRTFSDLTVIAPPVKEATKSAAGTKRDPGAAVKTVAKVNRKILSQAPAAAIAMLQYKAAEAGARCDVVTTTDSPALAGQELRAAAVAVRKLQQRAKRNDRRHETDPKADVRGAGQHGRRQHGGPGSGGAGQAGLRGGQGGGSRTSRQDRAAAAGAGGLAPEANELAEVA